MNKNLEEIILQAIDIVASKKIASAGYDKTILATVVSCEDEKTGKYKVKYQDSFWYAYSNNININYSKGANVYVLIPKGDMKQDKTILGGVRQLGVNYKNIAGGSSDEEQEALPINGKSIYVLNGQNLISNNIVLSLCSYKTETKVLYSKDVSAQENIIKINKENTKEYLTNSNVLAISMDIQNNLDFQQRYQGNYGVLVGLDFKDNATGDIVTRYYTLDIDNMTGNPYYYPNIVNQSQVFDIDGSNFKQINLISLFVRDFPKQDDTKDNDIFITNFQIGGASVLSQNDLLSYSLNIITPKGYIFNEYSASDEERTMQAELRSKGRVVAFKPEDMSIYWFVENGSVTTRNEKYSKYGGQGWACLNEYGIIQDQILDADGELVSPAIYGFLPSQVDYYTVKKSEILAKNTKFKCVVIYNENILSKEISILRHDSEYDIYITSDAGVKFYYDSGNPTLTCYCKHKQPNGTYTNIDISNLSFVWSMIDNIGNFSSLESQSNDKKKLTLIKQNILSYLDLEYITLEDIVDTSVIFPSDYAIAQLQDGQLKTKITEIKQNFISNGIEDQSDIVELFNTYDVETGNSITYNLFLNGDINHTRTITNAIKNYSNDQRVVDNQILNLSIRNITKFATFKCSVFTKVGNRFLGTGSITISNSLSVENEYTLVINNGNQLFKYNTHGISPTSKRLSNPQEIPLLSFSLYDPQGNEIEEQKLLTSDISWTIPVKDTLLKANSSYSGGIPSEDLKTITYKKLMTFSYTIAESYNIKKTNNDIQLKIVYNGMTLTTSTNLIFTKEGQQGTNGTQFVCKIIPNVESGETPVYPTIYYDGTNVSFNWNQDTQKPWFKVQLWHNDFEPIFVGTSSGNSTEDKLVTIEKWQVLRNTYKKNADDALAVQDQTNLTVTSNDSNNGWTFGFNPGTLRSSWTSQEYRQWRPANILKVTLNYDGNIYYGTLPVIVCRLFDANYYRSKLQDYTGFQHVLYSSAGIDPSYDSHDPFEIITEQFVDGKWNDISVNGINYNFLYTGSVWYRKKENGSYVWQEEFETTDNKGESSKRWLKKRYIGADALPVNQKAIQPVERYNGQCLNTALVCEVSRASDEKLLAWIHMPIHFSFNRFENSAINDWDGNSVDLGATNGGTILAPQAGMGYKDENNKFTGVLMGTVKDPNADVTNQTGSKSNEQAGLFAYHQGVRTAFIDAKTGKSTFGQQGQAQIIIDPTQTNSDGRKVAQIKSGNYDQNAKTGLLIDLSTPEIKYGSGNFSVDKDGKLYARGAYIDGSLSVNAIIKDEESGDQSLKSIFNGIDLKVSNLGDRMSQAELKITDQAIVSTVRSSDSYKSDLASKNTTFTGDYIPTTSNAPASSWTTTALKESHLNDTFLTSGGELYQYISGHNGLMITFSSDSKTETKWDYVRIYYQRDNKTYVLPDISGTDISGASVFVPSNEFWLYWRSDGTQVYYGFRIASIEWVFSNTPTLTEATLPGIEPTPMSGTNYPETTHPYTNNEEKFWKYTNSSHSASANPSYGWTKREDGRIRALTERMSAAELKITDSAIVSTVTNSQFGQTVTSTIKQTSDGIHLDAKYVSWSSTYSSMTKDGKLDCTSGQIGGFTIDSTALYNGISSPSASSGTGVYLGIYGINLGGGKFKVTPAGALTSRSGEIGGFTIGSTSLYNGISSVGATSGTGVYLGTDGINLGGGKFKVTSSGAFQWTMTNSSMSNTGVLKCSNAEISGKITSTSGTVGGWTINASSISRRLNIGSISLSANGIEISNGSTRAALSGNGIWMGSYDEPNYILEWDSGYRNISLSSDYRVVFGIGSSYIESFFTTKNNLVVRPYSWVGGSHLNMGTSEYRWTTFYSQNALNYTSDLKKKNVIKNYDWKIDKFIAGLRPIAFTRKDADDNKIHYGFGAQDIYTLANTLGLSNLFLYEAHIIDADNDEAPLYQGEDIPDTQLSWSLYYAELIAPIVLELQRLMKRVDALENGKGVTI